MLKKPFVRGIAITDPDIHGNQSPQRVLLAFHYKLL